MAISQTKICNLALSAVGTRSTIADLSENSAEAAQCALHYDPALEAVLRAAHWNFARKQLALALLKDGTVLPSQNVPIPWTYEYAYPSDALLMRFLLPIFQTGASDIPGTVNQSLVPTFSGAAVRFLIAQDLDASGNPIKVILTNQPQAIAVYTARVANPDLFDSDFVQAFALVLAAKLAIPLTGDKGLRDRLIGEAQTLANIARAQNGNESVTVIDSMPDWIRVRGFASDWAFPPGSTMMMEPQSLTLIA